MSNVKVKAPKKPVKPVIVVIYILLVILAVIYLAPLLWMLSVSRWCYVSTIFPARGIPF